MQLKPGLRLRSAVCDTEVIVTRGATDVDLRCGGAPMLPATGAKPEPLPIDDAFSAGTLLGKRYVDDADLIEVLCTKPGQGSLASGDKPLTEQGAKPLPASD